MAEDFIDRMQRDAKLRFGRELTPEEAALKFAEHGIDSRIEHLSNLNTPETLTVHGAAKRLTFERVLKNTHNNLRRIGR